MLLALSVIIGIICKNLFTWGIYYRVTFENFPIILAGFCFGPFYGAAVAVGADVISCLCSSNPVINPIITLGAAAVGFVSGIVGAVSRKLAPNLKNNTTLALSVAFAHLIGQVIIKSIGKIVMFGMPLAGVLVGLGISCVVGIIEFFLIRMILKIPEIAKFLT